MLRLDGVEGVVCANGHRFVGVPVHELNNGDPCEHCNHAGDWSHDIVFTPLVSDGGDRSGRNEVPHSFYLAVSFCGRPVRRHDKTKPVLVRLDQLPGFGLGGVLSRRNVGIGWWWFIDFLGGNGEIR